jgi:putative glutamine amidotransferase
MNIPKPIISWIREVDEAYFAQVFTAYPQIKLLNARRENLELTHESHGLLLTGGSDISAAYLKQPVPDPSLIQDADPLRDAWEFQALSTALAHRLPIFAICRGLQLLNVALGGTLQLDIPHHDSAKTENIQPVRYLPEVVPQLPLVNSSHHQAIAQLGAPLIAEAWCTTDNLIEQIRLPDYPFCLAVQFHPERDPIYQPWFDAFIEQVMATP